MFISKSVVIVTVFAIMQIFVEARNLESQPKNPAASESEASNPQMVVPRIGNAIPPSLPGVIPPVPVPSAPKLPGNLGINGNRWGASLLPKLEGLLGGLISGIHLDDSAVKQEKNRLGSEKPN